MSKTYAACDAALNDVKGYTAPRLVILTAATDERDPSTWTEMTDFATTNRPDLTGELTGAISTVDGRRVFTFPTQNIDLDGTGGKPGPIVTAETSITIAIVDGTAALDANTVGRIVPDSDFTDVEWTANQIPRLAANAYTVREG